MKTIQQKSSLTPEQQIFLRVNLSDTPIRTILHGKRMHEVIQHSSPLRLIQPWFESDGTESDSVSYWIPFHREGVPMPAQADVQSKRKEKPLFRPPHWTGEPRPKAQRKSIKTMFPSAPYLKKLVSELGYDKRAAMASIPQSYARFLRTGGRYTGGHFGKERQELAGQPLYLGSDIRHTTQGGGHKAGVVERVIARHHWDDPLPFAVFRVVCQMQKPSQVAKELRVNLGTLYTYSSMVRDELREMPEAA
jgi:hypothetical protein